MLNSSSIFRQICVLVALVMIAPDGYTQSLEVIDLKYRTAEEMIPILQPLLASGEAISGQDYKLFVRASHANLTQLRAAVAQLDRKPRQLLVSVRNSSEEDIRRERMSASGTIRSEDGEVRANEPPRNRSGVTVRGTASNSETHGGGISTVNVIEGASALISTGSSVPIVTTVAGGVGRHAWAASSTQYRDLSSGFLVTPRVNGNNVILDIEQQVERLRGATIDSQRLTTQISAQLGEWVQLGGIEHSSTSTQRGILNRQYSTNSDSRRIWIKVESE